MMQTWLFLLRHGATSLNLEKPYKLQGSGVDAPLALLGREQAQSAARLLQAVPLRAVYSSPLLRAMETALIVSHPHGLTATAVPELREGSVGRWENRTWDDIKSNEPDAYQQFIADPGQFGYAGGENFNQVLQRVRPKFMELLHHHQGQAIAVVGHQIVNRVMVADLMGLSMAQARKVKFANGGVSVISMEEDQPVLISLNITWPALVMP